MCGIAGIVSFDSRPSSIEELHAMCAATSHRGPDDYGFYVDANAALGMRRLSIIDVESGRQPVKNEDGSVWVVFNGEIYNFRTLRRELIRLGHSFATTSDTEVIVHLYEEYGPTCVERLRGMFAFALWDQRKKQLLLARDRFGIKPLYYAEVDGRLIFASELKAILQVPDVARELNWEAVSHLFTFLSTPPAESIVSGVHKLEPGHLLVSSLGLPLRIERYWDLAFEPDHGRSEAYFVERLRELLEESVRLHLISEVPLGAFLSGGIDSSSVVATMARISPTPVKTFSIGFPESDYNELEQARLVAKKFGTDHHEMILEPDVLGIIEDLSWFLDEPFGDSSAIPTYMVSKLASEHVTVVLSGDGGDEIFAGYDRYLVERRERRHRFLPSPARRLLGHVGRMLPDGMRGRNLIRHLSLEGSQRYLDSSTLFRAEEMQRLFRPEAYERLAAYDPHRVVRSYLDRPQGHWLSALQYLDLNSYLPLDILTKVDRMSMAHSIEARVPLLDHRLVEFAATIPPDLKLRNNTTKYILKRAMKGILPDQILERPKRGFAIPLGRWFRGSLGSFLRDLLLSERSRNRGIIDTSYVERLIQRHDRGRELDLHLWTLLSFEMWCRTFLDRTPRAAATPRPRREALAMSAAS